MGQKVRDIMTADPRTVTGDSTLVAAARTMREADVGPVIVTKDGNKLCGIVTDRDIAIRGVAEGKDPASTKVDEICSHDVTSVRPDDDADSAVKLMRERAIRRLPVVEGDRPVGIVSIGDLAVEKDPDSALADISAAPPND